MKLYGNTNLKNQNKIYDYTFLMGFIPIEISDKLKFFILLTKETPRLFIFVQFQFFFH